MKYLLAAETAPTEELTLWEEVVASLKTFFLDNWLNVVYFFVALLVGIVLVKIILRITRAVARALEDGEDHAVLSSVSAEIRSLSPSDSDSGADHRDPHHRARRPHLRRGARGFAGAAGFPLKPRERHHHHFDQALSRGGLRADQRRGGDGQKYPHAHHRAGDAGQ